MVLRVWRTGIDESRSDDYREFARLNSVPMFSAQPGFVAAVFAAAPEQRAVVTLWDSRASAEALEDSDSYQRTVAAIDTAGFLKGESSVEVFELENVLLGDDFPNVISRFGRRE